MNKTIILLVMLITGCANNTRLNDIVYDRMAHQINTVKFNNDKYEDVIHYIGTVSGIGVVVRDHDNVAIDRLFSFSSREISSVDLLNVVTEYYRMKWFIKDGVIQIEDN